MRPPGSGKFHRAPHQVVRYAPILELLRRLRPGGRVLEVGSGSEGVGTWWTRPFVGVDLEFTQRIARPLRPVRADAVRLPFRSRVFDVVLCIAVLPWLQGPAPYWADCPYHHLNPSRQHPGHSAPTGW